MKKRTEISSLDDLKIVTRTGNVLENQTLSRTHVHGHSSAESQYIGPYGGHIESPKISISSSTSEKVNLFIRGDDGREFEVGFINPGLAVREGNRISILYCGRKSESVDEIISNDYWISAIVNHSTGKSRIFEQRVRSLSRPTPAAPLIVRMIGPTLIVASIPVFIASIYYAFKWEIGFIKWIAFWCLYIGALYLFGWLGSIGSGALANEIISTLRQRIDSLLESS